MTAPRRIYAGMETVHQSQGRWEAVPFELPPNSPAYILEDPAALADSPEVQRLIRDGWREDPENSDAWCAGNNYALTRLCKVLGVDPAKVSWDGSDGSHDEEVGALIWRILHANDYDDGRSPAIREAEARGRVEGMERAAEMALKHELACAEWVLSGQGTPIATEECNALAFAIRAEAAAIKGEAE